MSRRRSGRSRTRAGFTLMEVLAAVFLTSIVIGAAVAFYLNLSNSSMRAREQMQRSLHASAVLERVARDIEGAVLLVKPEEMDPLSHPWFFVAGSRYAFDGADQLKFVTRTLRPRVTAYHSSDLGVVAFFTEAVEGGGYTLYRWLQPGPPLAYDPVFPDSDDPGSFELAEGLRSFSVRFQQEDGEWLAEWDSTQLVQSSLLPMAVEISLSLLQEEDAGGPGNEDEEQVVYYTRRVALPLRPLDLAAMIETKLQAEAERAIGAVAGAAGEEDGDAAGAGGGMTVAQCVQQNFDICRSFVERTNPGGGDAVCNGFLSVNVPVSQLPSLPAELTALCQ